MGVFQPRFIQANELQSFGIPFNSCSANDQSSLLDLASTASTMIDEYCGRTDGDGNGSLAYTTYQERLYDQSNGRGIFYLPKRPLAAVTQQTVDALMVADAQFSGYYYTGVQPNTFITPAGDLSCLIGVSGRYVPGRRDQQYNAQMGYADQYNPFELAELGGGIPPWQPLDLCNLDYSTQTGELWLGRDLLYASYREIIVVYNSGFNPLAYPTQLKRATALVMKNMMPRNGATGMINFSSAKSGASAQFTPDVIDDNIKRILAAFVSARVT